MKIAEFDGTTKNLPSQQVIERYMPFAMKSIQFVIFSLLLSTSNALAQKSLFLGSWNYFDNDNTYNEITISDHYIYRYSDSGGVERLKIKLTKTSLSFGKEIWVFKKGEKGKIEIQSNKIGKLRLFKLFNFGDELIYRYIRLGRMNLCKSLRVILYHFIN
jgi:hypothetical protein